MTLTMDQMTQITIDYMLGRTESITGPEADAFRKQLDKDVAEAKKNGWTLDIPSEFPDLG